MGNDHETIISVFVEVDKNATGTKQNLIIGCIYRPPWVDLSEYNSCMTNTLALLQIGLKIHQNPRHYRIKQTLQKKKKSTYIRIKKHTLSINVNVKSTTIRTRASFDPCLLCVFPISKTCANSFFDRSFVYAAPTLWNALDLDIRLLPFDTLK